MDLLLADKIGIVTGASRGIGKAIAETLSSEGMRVVLVARSRPELEALASSLPNKSLVHAVDLREPEAAQRLPREMKIARAVAFLASPQSGYIQGAILDLDGGATRAL